MEGAESTEGLLDRLTAAMARFQEQLDRVYRQQKDREDARRLREEQVTNECSRYSSLDAMAGRQTGRHCNRWVAGVFCGLRPLFGRPDCCRWV